MDTKEITERALSVPGHAKALIIKSNDDFIKAGQVLITIKELRKQIDGAFDPIIKKAHEAHKEAVAQKKKVDAPLVEAEGIIKPRIAAWNAAQERIRREEEERLREIARKEEEERRLKEAIAAEQSGKKEEAEAILETPVEVAPVIVPTTTPKVAGVSFRENWDFEIINVDLIPRQYLEPNQTAIRTVVKALKAQTDIPGIRVFSTTGVSARRTAYAS